MVNADLLKYIEENIFPVYSKNDLGHNLDHIKYVIERSMNFASTVYTINYDMVYTVAAYHDIGHFIDAKNHEKISAEILLKDENLRKFFNEEEIRIMSEAVNDHRASMDGEPRSIYGKIVSSADRNTSLDVLLKRAYAYRLKHNPEYSIDEIIDDAINHIIKKFGSNGYAVKKMYFKDDDYEKMLSEIDILSNDKELFRKKFIEVNEIHILKKYN